MNPSEIAAHYTISTMPPVERNEPFWWLCNGRVVTLTPDHPDIPIIEMLVEARR